MVFCTAVSKQVVGNTVSFGFTGVRKTSIYLFVINAKCIIC